MQVSTRAHAMAAIVAAAGVLLVGALDARRGAPHLAVVLAARAIWAAALPGIGGYILRTQVRQRNEAEQRLFALRNRALSEVLKKVSVPFNHAALQLVAYFALKGVAHEHTIRLAKRRKLKSTNALRSSCRATRRIIPAASSKSPACL